MIIEVPALNYAELSGKAEAEPSSEIKKRVDAARARQRSRLAGTGAELRPFPQEVMAAAFKEAFAMYGELAASNANFKTFYDSFLPYWKKEQLWFRIAELPFDAFNAQMSAQMR